MRVGDSECVLLQSLIILLSLVVVGCENRVKTDVFLSPKFALEPGRVSEKYFYGVDFPKGHIGIKSFNAEVIDEKGNSVPLHETYLHHWLVVRYYIRKGKKVDLGILQSDMLTVKNSGLCDQGLVQYFGLGSETRRTATDVPSPYGIEVGNPGDVPDGYEEKWMLNVHAIDTRGAEDKRGCTECRCDLYNVTVDGYNGGLRCCHDEARCRVKAGFNGGKRGLYLRYTVTYIDWDASIIPVEIYILDVTDIWTKKNGLRAGHRCLIEYEVESCDNGMKNDGCTHTKSLSVSFPTGGDVVYGVGHLHTGGTGITLYGEGGREICSSIPTYGRGDEAGNEAGYIVGMSTCYPSPGSVKVSAGERLTLVSNYSSAQTHTGVMGLFYLLVSDSSPKPNTLLHSPTQVDKTMKLSYFGWAAVLFGVSLVFVGVIYVLNRRSKEEDYERV